MISEHRCGLPCILIVIATLLPLAASADDYESKLESFQASPLTKAEVADGWLNLFDGETLFGWRNEGDADFRVLDGLVVAAEGTRPCLLRTTAQFDEYRLRVTFLSDIGTNSGIFLHTPPVPTNPAVDCYELNIADEGTNPFPTGSLVGRTEVAGGHDKLEWQTFDVTVTKAEVVVLLDGKEIVRYEDPKPLQRGCIGLQYNSGRIAFGNVQLQPLGLDAIFNGRDLSGWTQYPELEGEFSVDENGKLSVTGGRGQLESKGLYQDFILRLSCKTNAENLNSGLFFRCIPGELMNGYESQIHNGFVDGDRSKPVDCGTGGIFRQQDARLVVADDLEWFHKTIVAHGAHFAIWVNGIQVCDWTDPRDEDPNPRRGRRLDAGTLMIQAHDPTTDLLFDGIKVRTLDPRNR